MMPSLQIILIALVGLGGFALVATAGVLGAKRVARRYHQVEGRVEHCEAQPVAGARAYVVVLHYSYIVNGKTYQRRHVVAEVEGDLTPAVGDQLSRYYMVGQAVTVHYPADNPALGSLDNQVDDTLFSAFLLVTTGLMMILVAAQWIGSYQPAAEAFLSAVAN